MRSLIYVVFLMFAVSAYSAYFPLKETFFKDELKTLTLENATVKPSNPAVGSSKVYVKDGLVTLLGSDGVEAPIGGIRKWATATSYKQDDVVWYDGDEKIYRVVTAHTSGTFATDLSGGKLAEISATEALNHNDSLNKQGGTTDEYYHLTATQHNEATTEIDPIYIKNGGAELALSGWSCSANVTITRNTTTPLEGSADFLLDVTSSAVAGNYCQYAFTATNADMITKMVTASVKAVKYNTAYNNGDIRVCVYDVTAAKCLRTDYFFDTSPKFSADFQIETNSSLALRFEVVTPSVARTLQLDGIKVESQKPSTVGFVGTDFDSFDDFTWRSGYSFTNTATISRSGQNAKFNIKSIVVTPDVNSLYFDLSTLSVDIDALGITDGVKTFGHAELRTSAGISKWQGVVGISPATPNRIFVYYYRQDSTTHIDEANVNSTTPDTMSATDILEISFEVPILGWSSNMVLSSQTSNREIKFNGLQSSPVLGAVASFNATTVNDDTAGMWNGSTQEWILPEDGEYLFTGGWIGANTNAEFVIEITYLYWNGSTWASIAETDFRSRTAATTGTRRDCPKFMGKRTFPKGTRIKMQYTGTAQTGVSLVAGITKLNTGSQTIAKDAKVVESYDTSTQAINTSSTFLAPTTKRRSTHGAFNTSTGAFTAPRDGQYTVTLGMYSTSSFNSGIAQVYLYGGDGYGSSPSKILFLQTGTTLFRPPSMSASFYLKANETAKVGFLHSGSDNSTKVLAANSSDNWIVWQSEE